MTGLCFCDFSHVPAANLHYGGSVGVSARWDNGTIRNYGTALAFGPGRAADCGRGAPEAAEWPIHRPCRDDGPDGGLREAGIREWLSAAG